MSFRAVTMCLVRPLTEKVSEDMTEEPKSISSVLNDSFLNEPSSEEEVRERLERGVQRHAANIPDPDRDALEARKRLTEGVAYVYVPTHPSSPKVQNPGHRQVKFELRQLPDGSGGLPVFTEAELLVAQLGEFQPWERIPVLELLIQVSAAKVQVVVNPVVQEDAKRWTAADLEAWQEKNQ